MPIDNHIICMLSSIFLHFSWSCRLASRPAKRQGRSFVCRAFPPATPRQRERSSFFDLKWSRAIKFSISIQPMPTQGVPPCNPPYAMRGPLLPSTPPAWRRLTCRGARDKADPSGSLRTFFLSRPLALYRRFCGAVKEKFYFVLVIQNKVVLLRIALSSHYQPEI